MVFRRVQLVFGLFIPACLLKTTPVEDKKGVSQV